MDDSTSLKKKQSEYNILVSINSIIIPVFIYG